MPISVYIFLLADTANTADAYAKIRHGEGKAGKGTLWQALFGGSDSGSTDTDMIKAAAGKQRNGHYHKAKPMVTAAA